MNNTSNECPSFSEANMGSLEGWVAFKPGIFLSNSSSNRTSFSLRLKEDPKGSRMDHDDDDVVVVVMSTSTPTCCCRLKDFQSLHRDILCLNPSRLQSLFPSSLKASSSLEALLGQLEVYLEEASCILSPELIVKLLTNDEYDSFEEDIQELRLKSRESDLESSMKKLQEVLSHRTTAQTMIQTSCLWRLEDEAVDALLESLGQKYAFQVIPFLRSREVEIKSSKDKITSNEGDLRDSFLSNSMALQQLYSEYHRKVLQVLKSRFDRLTEDKSKFGAASFLRENGPQRLRSFFIEVAKQKITVLSVEKSTMELQRSLIKDDIKCSSSEGKDVFAEKEYLESHLNVLDLDIKILNEEEILLKKQLSWLRNDDVGQDEVEEEVFFDAVESQFQENIEFLQSKEEHRHLIERLTEIRRKRAKIRNKISLVKSRMSSLSVVSFIKKKEVEPSMTTTLDQAKSSRRSMSPKTLSVARIKAIKRVKEYRNKHSKDAETGEALPPFPSTTSIKEEDRAIDDDNSFPAPPEEVVASTTTVTIVSSKVQEKEKQPLTTQPIMVNIPVPPPMPMVIPPPPPPPLPPLVTPAVGQVKKTSSLPIKAPTSTSTILDLSQILETRKSLRKTFPVVKPSSSCKTNNPLLATLMNRIREVRKDDSSSSSEDDHDNFE